MSLNIQTANGLLEIGGNVTKEKVISALGYEPVDKTHISDKTLHVTSEERETWNNKSDFSGAYADLIDAPSITETESGNMVIADESGNIIMQVDADGLETTNVSARAIELNGKDLGERLDELEATSLPNILDNETGDLSISDESGNVIMKVSANGLETTAVTAKSAVINGIDIAVKFDEHTESINDVGEGLSSHKANSTIHITADERTLWNNKSDFSGDFNDLTNAPDIKEDESGEVVYADEAGNVIVRIGEAGLETTQVTAGAVITNGINIGSTVSTHTGDENIHITSEERSAWNEKASVTYVDEKIADLVDSSPEALNTLNELATALGDDPNFASTVAEQIGSKANQADLDAHTSSKGNPHKVTAAQIGLGNVDNTSDINKPVSTAQQAALDNLKSEFSESIISESDKWIIADEDGNVVARVDESGFETTTVTATVFVVNGIDVEVALTGKADGSHTHDQYLEAEDVDGLATTEYVDEKLAEKADTSHAHHEYLVAEDIANKANTSYVDEQLATKVPTTRKINNKELSADITLSASDVGALPYTTVIPSIEGLATEEYVDQAIAQAQLDGKVDLSSYYTKDETDEKIEEAIDAIEHPTVDLTSYATTEYVDAQLETKAGINHTHKEYLTSDDISSKADTSYVAEQLLTKADSNHTHEEYLVSIPDEYITETELEAKQYLTSIPVEYITEEELAAKGYLTQHQDLSDYAKKSDIPEVIDSLTSSSSTAALSAAQGAALKTAIDSITGDIGELGGGDMMKATYDTNNNGIVDNAEKLDGHAADYFAAAGHVHDNYLTGNDISSKADISYVDEELATAVAEAKEDASNKDAVVLFEAQKGIDAVQITIADHIADTGTHITYAERTSWNGKANQTYVNEELDKKANVDHAHDEYLVADNIANKADKSELHEHSNKDALDGITLDKVSDWDNKSDFSGSYNDLTDTPNMLDDKSPEFNIADANENVIFRVDINGTRTTSLETEVLVLSGVDVGTKLDNKADKATTLEGYGITDAASKEYVDTIFEGLTTEGTADAAIVQAALTAHTGDKNNPHNVTLGHLGISVAASELNYLSGVTSNVQNQLNTKASIGSLSGYYTKAEIDSLELITVADIDAICAVTT